MNILTINRLTAAFGLFALASTAKAQEPADTITRQQLDQVTVVHYAIPLQVYTPDKLHGSSILAARRAEIIPVGRLNADPAANLSRQLFSRTPGIQSWENDGSGIQTGIAARGLSPNRSWEFNVRQNGTDIAPDVFGYPEAYYTPPAEAVATIELVRGAASLQFGPQFGGLLNYVIRKGDSDKKISVDARHTVGSYGLFNSYTGVGGTYGKVNYYAWFHYRRADGWRENSGYATRTGYINLDYHFSERTTLGLTYTSSYYKSQQ
ncbi:MAG: TonB-dependent receptor plug domain-containing protein, partial [Flavobacteriales bacterium]|nr:TonB-dependent receptor plug domain-containing protein [Flavobacteriales bacterium]